MIKYSFLVLPIEKLLERAGNAETYQIRCLILFSIQWLFSSIIFSGYQLFLIPPTIQCYKSNSQEPFYCTEEQACSGIYFYRFNPDNSLISQFDLICDRSLFADLCNLAFYIGAFVGAYYYSEVLQRKGRLFVITQTTTLIGTVLLISNISVHIYINIIMLFMTSFALFGLLNATITYFVEVTGGSLRILGPNCFLVGWALGQIFYAIFSQTFDDWKTSTFFIMAVPMIITAFFFRFMKESPRFLVTQEKFEEAKTSLRNMAKINGKSMPDFSFESEMRQGLFGDNYMFVQNDIKPSITPEMKKNKNIFTIFRYDTLKSSAWIMLIFWVVLTIDNHANILSLNQFHHDKRESLIITGMVQLFGYLISCYFALNYNRRPVIGLAFLVIGVVYIILFAQKVSPFDINLEESTGFVIFLAMLGKASVCVALGTLYNVAIELFPTNVRHFSFGLFYCVSQFGLFVLVALEEYVKMVAPYPVLVLGIVNVAVVFLTRNMQETLNKRIADYIREEDELLLNFELKERE